ncbi:MAG: oxygen-dependent coproporphyrinogen oxidase [Bacteroidota bacterium]
MIHQSVISDWFKDLQDRICTALEDMDGQGRFHQDLWERPGGGGGRTRIIQGAVIEKGGVNFSAVEGQMPEKIAKALKLEANQFFATGVSIVLHPRNPWVPIIHMNVRYFETDAAWWFGGGIDLTPHYVFMEDAQYFHRELKRVCDQHDANYYPKFKKWADDYFYVKHRKETRGIGGIFFDRLSGEGAEAQQKHFSFVQDVGNLFSPVYIELANRHRDQAFEEQHKEWQYLRRGRYVEFNLVWDKGTKFGLDTDGRTESILMSLPPQVSWVYNHQVADSSMEASTLSALVKDYDWIGA